MDMCIEMMDEAMKLRPLFSYSQDICVMKT